MLSFLKDVAHWFSGSPTPATKPRRPARSRNARLEQLEERRVLTTGFIDAVYEDVLHRPADPAGQAYFANLLATGSTPLDVATLIWASAEHRGMQVDSYYQTYLHRPADPVGRQFWITEMEDGVSEETVVTDMLNSPEYLAAHPTQTQFITGLYQDLLNRAPDAAGLTTWMNVMTQRPGTTPGKLDPADEAYVESQQWPIVLQSIFESTERETTLVDAMYTNFLNRPADPAGLANWVPQIASIGVQSVSLDMLTSTEFMNDHPTP
jgi:hypothetical protein